jgi:hypothetical protein
MSIWKHFEDPKKNQKISVNITGGEVSVVINDGVGAHYAQRITPPETYATKRKQEEVKKYILSMEMN